MKFIIIFINIGFLCLLPFTIQFALFYQVFDHYIRLLKNEWMLQIFYLLITSFPVVIFLANLISWIYWARKKYQTALLISLSPLVSVILYFVLINLPR